MPKSIASRRNKKQQSLPPAFPLAEHPSGRWFKTAYVGGQKRFFYFGPISDPDAAVARFNREWPYLKQGRTPPPLDSGDGCTFRNLCNRFLTHKKNRLDSGELSPASFDDYQRTCDLLIGHFGADRRVDDLLPDDFEEFRKALATRYNAQSLKNRINRCRIVLKFAYKQRLIDREPHYGASFDFPSTTTLQKARNQAGPRMFKAAELRRIIKHAADAQVKAMILLGVNCGFGNTDVASLPQSAIDFKNGWIEFPRPKTAVMRRIPLWPATITVLKKAIAKRPEPKTAEDATLCFLTIQGNRWVRTRPGKKNEKKYVTVNTLAHRFAALLRELKINGRKGLGFYTLRHVFETIGGESKDQVAVNAIMGHKDNTMAGQYREGISDERLQAVVDTVHKWLFEKRGHTVTSTKRDAVA